MRDAPTLRAHPNVIDMAEWKCRRMSSQPVRFEFIGWRAAAQSAGPPPSHSAAQALLAGLMQGMGERQNDPALLDAGKRLAEAARKAQPSDDPPEAPRKPYGGFRWFRRT